MKRLIWILSGVMLLAAALEFGALGAAAAGASFVPSWINGAGSNAAARNTNPCPTGHGQGCQPTPISPPACQPDSQHGHAAACDGQPASMQLTPDPLTIHCDGVESSTVTVTITDVNGRPVPDGTLVRFAAYDGTARPSFTQTKRGIASTSVVFYSDIFPPGPNVTVDAGAFEAGVRVRCFPNSNQPACPLSPPSSPPCAPPPPTPTPSCGPASPPVAPPSISPPCATPTISPCAPSCGTIEVRAPEAPQPLDTPFTVTDNLTSTAVRYAGWQVELAYDASVIAFDGGSAGGLCTSNAWVNQAGSPPVVVACIALNSTDTGVMDVLAFHCIVDGTSALTLVPPANSADGTFLYGLTVAPVPATLVSSSVTCKAGSQVTPTITPTATNTPSPAEATATAAASQTAAARPTVTGLGDATISVIAPSGAQALNTPFQVTDRLTSFLPGTSATWAGWELELAYDTGVLAVDSVQNGGICPVWGSTSSAPHVQTGCAFQENAGTGTMDVITFHCIANGVSQLTLLSRTDPGRIGVGTSLFDFNAVDFDMTLVSTSVVCGGDGTGIRPIALSSTPTAVPTATATP